MKRLQAILCSLLVVFSAMADITARGKVIDGDNNEPMIGVSILVKGTTQGTITDFDGNFELTAPNGATLQFTYLGYKTVELPASANMSVRMETDATELQEVVSLGYSAVKKAELSSAVVTISAEALTDVTSSDVGNMLQGKIAGVQVTNAGGQPGDAAQIRIRGTGSITAGSDPVYVVDGVIHYAVDNTPAMFPKTVSKVLSEGFAPYVDDILEDRLPEALEKAMVIRDGQILDERIRSFREARGLACSY